MKVFLSIALLIGVNPLGMNSAYASDPSCNDLLSGLSDEWLASLHDLSRLRVDLDQRLAHGENSPMVRALQSEYFVKLSEIADRLKVDRDVLEARVRVEVERIQEDAKIEGARRARIKKIEQQEVIDSETHVKLLGKLSITRVKHTQVTLPDGRVMVLGGYDGWEDLGLVEVVDPITGTVEIIGHLKEPRQRHTQSLLLDGRVLIAGGNRRGNLDSIEVFDWSKKTSTLLGHLIEPKYGHAQSLLKDGRVLISGGMNKTYLSTIEVIDPSTGKSTEVGQLKQARYNHRQSLLLDGRVLITGGADQRSVLTSIEVFDVTTQESKIIGNIADRREGYAQAVLPDGRVLISGGYGGGQVYFDSIEVIDPTTGESKKIGMLQEARYDHTQSVLPDGRILIAGGYGGKIGKKGRVQSKLLSSIEVFNPATGKSEIIGDLHVPRGDHTESVLPDGQVMVIGGNGTGTDRLDSIEFIKPRKK